MRSVLAVLIPCFVQVFDAWGRTIDDATVTCDKLENLVHITVTRDGYLPSEIDAGSPSSIMYLRRPGDWWLAWGGHKMPFVPELDKLLVVVRRGADVTPLLEELGLIVTSETIPPEIVHVPQWHERCEANGMVIIVKRADGRPFSAAVVPELARLRKDTRVVSAGPLIHQSNVPDRALSVGHQIRLGTTPTADELARLARDYGASFDQRTSVLTLRPSIGLEAVLVTNAIVELRVAMAGSTLELGGVKICMD